LALPNSIPRLPSFNTKSPINYRNKRANTFPSSSKLAKPLESETWFLALLQVFRWRPTSTLPAKEPPQTFAIVFPNHVPKLGFAATANTFNSSKAFLLDNNIVLLFKMVIMLIFAKQKRRLLIKLLIKFFGRGEVGFYFAEFFAERELS
jgi:hypothetical protein